MEEEEGSFRAREPWYVRIRGIINNQYPEGSQVFEVLQNADDSGAKEVIFVLDKNFHQVNPQTLKEPKLSDFHSPSLMVFNDGKFQEKDWASIQTLGDSGKKDDPSKTGLNPSQFKNET